MYYKQWGREKHSTAGATHYRHTAMYCHTQCTFLQLNRAPVYKKQSQELSINGSTNNVAGCLPL